MAPGAGGLFASPPALPQLFLFVVLFPLKGLCGGEGKWVFLRGERLRLGDVKGAAGYGQAQGSRTLLFLPPARAGFNADVKHAVAGSPAEKRLVRL